MYLCLLIAGPVTDVLNGTCVPLHAQFDENCGEFCPCDLSQGFLSILLKLDPLIRSQRIL